MNAFETGAGRIAAAPFSNAMMFYGSSEEQLSSAHTLLEVTAFETGAGRIAAAQFSRKTTFYDVFK